MPWAGLAPPTFGHLTPDSGLPYPVSFAVAQDGDGFIWIATPGGVARWDGYRVRVYRHSDDSPASLPENIATDLTVDGRGVLWVATASGIVARYDREQDGFVAYRRHASGLGRLLGMASDGKGGLWAVGRWGMAHLSASSNTWQSKGGGEIDSVAVDRAGCLWLGAQSRIMRRCGDGPLVPIALPAEAAGDRVTALYEDRAGTMWFGDERGRVGHIPDPAGPAVMAAAVAPSGHRVSSMVEPRPGTLWIGQFGGGIVEYVPAAGTVRTITAAAARSTSLSDNSVTGMIRDRSGLVWVSTQKGVDHHIPANASMMTIVRGEGGRDLPGSNLRSVAAAGEGRMWLGFRDAGLALMDPRRGIVMTLPPGRNGLPQDRVQALADMGKGRVWAGLAVGLFHIDVATGKATQFGPLGRTNVEALLRDKDDLWAGGSFGVARIAANGELRLWSHNSADSASLSDDSAMAVFRDHLGRMWVGTQHGLNLLEDPAQGRFRRYFNDPGDPHSLPSDVVNSIAEDRRGRLWVGTGNGIGILDADGGRFQRLGTAQGLANDTVLAVVARRDGSILAGTGDGLSLIDPLTLKVRTFGAAEGVGIRTFWAGSGTELGDGTVIMGGFGGMVVVRPGVPPRWEYRPQVVTTDVRLDGQVVPPAASVTIAPGHDRLQVEFSALDYSAPAGNRYAYRLVGREAGWITTDSQHRVASYGGLRPGRYRLEVNGSNSSGIWSGLLLTRDIQVLPAWYQTMWFRGLMVVAVLGGLLGVALARRAYFLSREQVLARQVALKTAEARQAMDAAEAANRAKSRFLAVVAHEIRTPLNGLLGMLQMLEPERVAEKDRPLLAGAKDAGDNLRHLVENVLDFGREEAGDPVDNLKDVDIRRLAEETVGLFRSQTDAKGVSLSLRIDPPGPLWVRCDVPRIGRLLQNLLGNAVKFTQAGFVDLSIVAVDKGGSLELLITVSDSGVGIAPELLDAVFEDFVQADGSHTRRFGGVGLGLAICRRIVARMGGTLTVDSRPGNGTIFRVTAPVARGQEPAAAPRIAEAAGPSLVVLVVDDDEMNRRVAEAMLDRLGHRSAGASSGSAAVAVATAAAFDVILMDLRMPGMDGTEAARIILGRPGRDRVPRIVAMTADDAADVWGQCAAAGMVGLVRKPVRLEDLRRALVPGRAAELPGAPPVLRRGVDLVFLEQQLELLGWVEIVRLARLFQQTTRRLVAALDQAVATAQRPEIRRLAHTLRSASGPLGLAELADCARRLEQEAEDNSLAGLAAWVEQAKRARIAALDTIRTLRAEGKTARD